MGKRAIASIVVGTAIVASTAVTIAFPFNKSWHEAAWGSASTNRAGAGGYYGTGGRKDKGIKCSHCHILAPGVQSSIGVTVTTTPAFVVSGNDTKYVPGQTYMVTIALTGEHLGGGKGSNDPTSMNNKNSMAATIENANGQRAGRFVADSGQDTNACPAQNPYPGAPGPVSPVGMTTFMYGDCHGVLPLQHSKLTSWRFTWYAPAAGAGDLTLYIGMVDGDTDGHSSLDDDVLEKSIPLKEGP